jgi:hypothetical protein
MSAAYAKALAGLSPEGRNTLRASQLTFLNFAATRCQPGKRPLDALEWDYFKKKPNYRVVAECVAATFTERTKVLDRAVVSIGGRVFLTTRHDRVRAARPDDPTAMPDAVHEERTTPQIDGAKSKAERDWNAAMAAWAIEGMKDNDLESGDYRFERDERDAAADVEVVSASPDLIVASLGISSYAKGAAHPQSWTQSRLWSLKLGRALKAEDIFRSDRPWKSDLVARIQAHLKGYNDKGPTKLKVGEFPPIDKWLPTKAGMLFVFDPYALGAYVDVGESLVPWSELKPDLRSDLPFDPAQIEDSPFKAG